VPPLPSQELDDPKAAEEKGEAHSDVFYLGKEVERLDQAKPHEEIGDEDGAAIKTLIDLNHIPYLGDIIYLLRRELIASLL